MQALFTWIWKILHFNFSRAAGEVEFVSHRFEEVDGGKRLVTETWMRKPLNALLRNPFLEREVLKAARSCSSEKPLLALADKSMAELNSALSKILLPLLDEGVSREKPLFSTAYEPYGEHESRKIRVLLIAREDLFWLRDWQASEQRLITKQGLDRVRMTALSAMTHSPLGMTWSSEWMLRQQVCELRLSRSKILESA